MTARVLVATGWSWPELMATPVGVVQAVLDRLAERNGGRDREPLH